MAKGKTLEYVLELNDGITLLEGMEIYKQAMKDIAPVNVDGDGYLGWDMSSNVPGWTVELRDYGVGKPQRVIIGKAPRVRKNATKDKTAC